ncbi:hypothetical protein PAXRUDRAFT_13610 [Paxillus rubicundulus Ve08.2h10]|uniref:Uncharacterized protein n=1 Tax=Paxillus rubicundulus Ve08.2h10 TaxID=930991 RepID=A0A0D0D560_9AGAM|nr:hypothetical protein PAXRUDRAFT_13610 [Paxillus rubicundulus Ve08.2h10]
MSALPLTTPGQRGGTPILTVSHVSSCAASGNSGILHPHSHAASDNGGVLHLQAHAGSDNGHMGSHAASSKQCSYLTVDYGSSKY